ncbi:hypothetical protein ACI6Q2_04625 [Chitinophagaceae bacterium LWZ2-11]
MEQQTQPESQAQPELQEELLDLDALSPEGYDKKIRNVRIFLFIIAAFQIGYIFFLPSDVDPIANYITIGIFVAVAITFVLLAFWTKKKPYTAIITALIIYCSLLLLDIIFDPASILKGILIKIVFISLMVSSLSSAKDIQNWRKLKKEI